MLGNQKGIPVYIAAGASLSTAALMGDGVLVGILMPTVWTAASLTFQWSYDGQNWYELYDTTPAEVTLALTVGTGQMNAINTNPNPFLGVVAIKVRSGTLGAAVNQVAAATVILVTRKLFALR